MGYFDYLGPNLGNYNPGFSAAIDKDTESILNFGYQFSNKKRAINYSQSHDTNHRVYQHIVWDERRDFNCCELRSQIDIKQLDADYSMFHSPHHFFLMRDGFRVESSDNKTRFVSSTFAISDSIKWNIQTNTFVFQTDEMRFFNSSEILLGNLNKNYLQFHSEHSINQAQSVLPNMENYHKHIAQIGIDTKFGNWFGMWHDLPTNTIVDGEMIYKTGWKMEWKRQNQQTTSKIGIIQEEEKGDVLFCPRQYSKFFVGMKNNSQNIWFNGLYDKNEKSFFPGLKWKLMSERNFEWSCNLEHTTRKKHQFLYVAVQPGTGNFDFDSELQEYTNSPSGDFIRQTFFQSSNQSLITISSQLDFPDIHFNKVPGFGAEYQLKVSSISDDSLLFGGYFQQFDEFDGNSLFQSQYQFSQFDLCVNAENNYTYNNAVVHGKLASYQDKIWICGKSKFQNRWNSEFTGLWKKTRKTTPFGIWRYRDIYTQNYSTSLRYSGENLSILNVKLDISMEQGQFDNLWLDAKKIGIQINGQIARKRLNTIYACGFTQVLTDFENIMPPDMVDGFQTGKNYFWSLDSKWRIAQHIELSVRYSGRYDKRRKLKHQAIIITTTQL